MTTEPLRHRIAEWALTAAEWAFRAFVAALGLAGLVASGAFLLEAPLAASLGAAFSLYVIVGMLRPTWLTRGWRWLRSRLSHPYDGFFVPRFIEPLEAAFERAFAAIGTPLARLLKALIWLSAGAIALVLVGLAGIWLVNSVDEVPLSVAVIIGALIIAAAIRAGHRK